MTFLNATLIFGVLAAGVPIVLHLIAKKEPRREVFPAIRFLTKRFDTNRTRLKVKRWWLLLLRVLALIALAVALARPTIHRDLSIAWLSIALVSAAGVALLVLATIAIIRGMQKRTAFGLAVVGGLLCLSGFGWGGYTLASGERAEVSLSSPIAVAIVIDNSVVSTWNTQTGSHLDAMQDQALAILRSLPATSRSAVIDRSARPPAFAVDVPAAMAQVDQLKSLQVSASMESRLRSAARLLGTSDLKTKFLISVTDSSVSSWTPTPPEAIDGEGVEVVVVDVGSFDSMNRRLELAANDTTPAKKLAHPLAGAVTIDAGSAPLDTSLATVGDASATAVRVELRLYDSDPSLPLIRNGELVLPDSQVVDRTSLQVAPGTRSEFNLMTPPLEEGLHHLSVELVGSDALAIDDRLAVTLSVETPPRLLVVAKDRSESWLIASAITAPREPGHPDAEFSVDEVTFDDVMGLRLADYAAVVLLDPPQDLIVDDLLTSFVASGGSCFVSLGPSFQPGRLADGVVAKRIWRVSDEGTFFQTLRANHPVLMPLEQASQPVRWTDFRVEQYWQFDNREDVQTLLQFAGTNHPALFLVDDGDGQWVVLTTPLTTEDSEADVSVGQWNRLWGADAWPTFVLVHQISEFLARRDRPVFNTLVGTPLTIRVDDVGDSIPPPDSNQSIRWQLFAPDSVSPVPMTIAADAEVVQVTNVPVAGNYWLRSAHRQVGFSANLPAGLTAPGKVDASVWGKWFGEDGHQHVTDVKDIEFVVGQQDVAVSLRSPALLLALAVFLFEQLLGNRFYQSSHNATGNRHASGIGRRLKTALPTWFPWQSGSRARST